MKGKNMTEIKTQIKNAFEFIQKLYYESSYLIKEIEGQLGESDNPFQILKPTGYSVSSRSSTGLESNNVSLWLLRKFSVAFVEVGSAESSKGQNITEITSDLKVLYFKFTLDDKNIEEPELMFGVFYNIASKKESVKKFENLMGILQYTDNKVFTKFPKIDYTDNTFTLEGKFQKVNLLDITSSIELQEKVIKPIIEIYDKIK
jgi:hypothetical protein